MRINRRNSLLLSCYGKIAIILEVKIQFDGMVSKSFTIAKNPLKIRQMKGYCEKVHKLDLKLDIWIISPRIWEIKSNFERAWFHLLIFSLKGSVFAGCVLKVRRPVRTKQSHKTYNTNTKLYNTITNLKQNHKIRNTNTKLCDSNTNLKQNHKIRNTNTKLCNTNTNLKQNHKISNTNTKLCNTNTNFKQNHKIRNTNTKLCNTNTNFKQNHKIRNTNTKLCNTNTNFKQNHKIPNTNTKLCHTNTNLSLC